MAQPKPTLSWLSTVLRALIWLTGLTTTIVLFLWRPVILLGIGVLLGLVVIAAFIVGSLFWNGDGHTTSTSPVPPPR